MHTTQTNPFLVYVQGFDTLITAVERCKDHPWQSCIAENAMKSLWSIEDRGQQAHDDLFRRYRRVSSSFTGGSSDVCLDQAVRGTYHECFSGNFATCKSRLQRDIDQMRCDQAMLPKVWDAENASNDQAAAGRRDADCRRRFP
jgi:hypothetical protein